MVVVGCVDVAVLMVTVDVAVLMVTVDVAMVGCSDGGVAGVVAATTFGDSHDKYRVVVHQREG
ncbi:unnamed protein product [Prunus armeniaca]|uniref:Uncharacterized protein n=1 Tax=Prunus armeniaca TaxID=36596 RepID=A0A6J5TIZ6_PRUAR|nr:unnamed protein product [Prunus armeniaca]